MSAANNILPFSQSGSALVESQATYLASAVRPIGNQNGIADPQLVNKALLQTSAMAVGLAQFLADNQSSDISDSLLGPALSTIIANAIKNLVIMPAGAIIWMPANAAPTGTLKLNGALLSRTTFARLWAFAQTSGNMAASDGAWVSGQFSPGDGSTTFRIPDLRGYELRAWDDSRGVDSGRTIGSVQADQLLSHTHGYTDPSHTHTNTINDVGHTHTVTVTDPSHNHSHNDPTHVHSINDPGHTHGVPHADDSSTAGLGISGNISTAATHVTTDQSSSTGVSLFAAATGITNLAATTGITAVANSNGGGTSVNNASQVTGITIAGSVPAGGTEVRVKNIALLPCIYY